MDVTSIIAELEREWDLDSGFFGRLRRGEFEEESLKRVLRILAQIELQGDRMVHRRLVSLIWYMPLFMSWQRSRVQDAGSDVRRFDESTNEIERLVEQILGIP